MGLKVHLTQDEAGRRHEPDDRGSMHLYPESDAGPWRNKVTTWSRTAVHRQLEGWAIRKHETTEMARKKKVDATKKW